MTGRVVLVGGGPGAADLITVRGLDRLREADVVVHDRLAPNGLLDGLGPHVERVDAARGPDRRTLSYDEIVGLMIARAREGKTVVRLKGGDPFVLAHGPQEVASCTAAGVAVEVVPGVTSAIAGPVLAGVPLTAIDGATGFTVVSGHVAPGDPANRLDWAALVRGGTTLVVLMGMRHLSAIAATLIAEGLPADTAASCIADASLASQRAVHAPLSALAEEVTAAGLTNPAVVVVAAAVRPPARRALVLGGSRSGKSAFAEGLLAGTGAVDYVATAAHRPGDEEWSMRIAAHRERREQAWRTVETLDVAGELARDGDPVLVDSVTTWLARVMDECGAWAATTSTSTALGGQLDRLCARWASTTRRAVLVSDEVGGGIVPATESGRRFRDELGALNQRLAASADAVHLVTAGIAQRLR